MKTHAELVAAIERGEAEDAAYLTANEWREDRGRWIWRGDTGTAFTLEAAVRRQRRADVVAAECAAIERRLAGAR